MNANASASVHRRPRARRIGLGPQRGVTLLELLIGVGVIIVFMVGVLIGMRSLNAQMDRSALLRQAPQIKVSLGGLGASGDGDFASLDTATAIAMGAFPREMITGSGANAQATHPFGGPIFAKGLADDFETLKRGRAFSLTYAAIPADQCAGVARGLAMLGEGLWIDATGASPAAMPAAGDMLRVPGKDAPIDIGALAEQCVKAAGAGDAGKAVTIHVLMAL
ncbi:hypothetical protein [Roseateles sp.]|uniref:hypothetical protein n=1 Tax=Roseateles sp. TaxID=1971397 RepID=UPI002F40A923